MRPRPATVLTALTVTVLALAVLAQPASAATLGHPVLPLAGLFDFLDPIKDIGELIGKVVGKLFGQLAKALMPDFLKHASVSTLQGLVALPDVANTRNWRNVGQLRSGTTAIAWALLPLPFTLSTIRYLVGSFTDGPNPIMAVARLVGAAFGLVIYPWAAAQTFTFVNVLTHALLDQPAVGHGLQRAVSVLFGSAILAGIGTPFLAVLALIAIVLGALLFALKIAIVMIAALLYVSGPLVIALRPLQETSHLFRAWLFAVIAVAFIPVGWCLLFAVAGALTLDATSGGISAGLVSKDITAALAALLSFALAVLWPKLLISHALHIAGGMGISMRGAGRTVSQATGGSTQRATRQLRDHALAASGATSRAGAASMGTAGAAGRGWATRLMGAAASGGASAAGAAIAGTAAGTAGQAASRGAAVSPSANGAAGGSPEPSTAGALPGLPDNTATETNRTSSPSSAGMAVPEGASAPAPVDPPARPGEVSTDVPAPSSAPSPSPSRRGGGSELTDEQRGVLRRLPRDIPGPVRAAVATAGPGRAARAATAAARTAGAPLPASTRRAVFAVSNQTQATHAVPAGEGKPPAAAAAAPRPTSGPGHGGGEGVPGARPEPTAPAPTGSPPRRAAPSPVPSTTSGGRPRPSAPPGPAGAPQANPAAPADRTAVPARRDREESR